MKFSILNTIISIWISIILGHSGVYSQQVIDTLKEVSTEYYKSKAFRKNKFKKHPEKIKIRFLDQFLLEGEVFENSEKGDPKDGKKDDSDVDDKSASEENDGIATVYLLQAQKLIHQIEIENYVSKFRPDSVFKLESDWDKIQHIKIDSRKSHEIQSKKSGFIYAMHPFWMGRAYTQYPVSIFNRLGYYAYIVDPHTGEDASSAPGVQAHSWSKSPVSGICSEHNSGLDLVVAMYGKENNSIFFSEEAHFTRRTVVKNVGILLKEKGNGVCLDFQQIPDDLKAHFISFVKELDKEINKNSAVRREITLVVPKIDVEFPYSMTLEDWHLMSNSVDRVILTGDDPYLSGNLEAGKESSLLDNLWNLRGIDNAVNHYPPGVFEKLILEIPLYSASWNLHNNDTVLVMAQYRDLFLTNPVLEDDVAKLLKDKLTYVRKKGLKGVSLWAGGYDLNSRVILDVLAAFSKGEDLVVQSSLANMIDSLVSGSYPSTIDMAPNGLISDPNSTAVIDKSSEPGWLDKILSTFGFSENVVTDPVSLPGMKIKDHKNSLNSSGIAFHHVVVLCLMVLLFFAIVGFIIAMFYESGREVLFSKEYFFYLLALIGAIASAFFLHRLNWLSNGTLMLITGVVLGIIVSLIFKWRKMSDNDELRP